MSTEEVDGYLAGVEYAKGSLHVPVDQPLPDELVRRLFEARLSMSSGRE